jgi:hypothetical protein
VVVTSVDHEAMRIAVQAWIRSRWLAPSAFRTGGENAHVELVYSPVYLFATGSHTNYNATVSDRGVPSSRDGQFDHWFEGIPVAGSELFPPEQSWRLEDAVGFADRYVAGTTAYLPTVPISRAWDIAEQKAIRDANQIVLRNNPGPNTRIVDCFTVFMGTRQSCLLVPSWTGDYVFADKTYPIIINAQTGKVSGTYPLSLIRLLEIGVIAVAAFILIASLTIAILQMHQGGGLR